MISDPRRMGKMWASESSRRQYRLECTEGGPCLESVFVYEGYTGRRGTLLLVFTDW